jgi:hypothetical protein
MSTADAALPSLQDCRRSLVAARLEAVVAANSLDGARLARAQELAQMVADCIAWCERLAVVVLGDARAESHR